MFGPLLSGRAITNPQGDGNRGPQNRYPNYINVDLTVFSPNTWYPLLGPSPATAPIYLTDVSLQTWVPIPQVGAVKVAILDIGDKDVTGPAVSILINRYLSTNIDNLRFTLDWHNPFDGGLYLPAGRTVAAYWTSAGSLNGTTAWVGYYQ